MHRIADKEKADEAELISDLRSKKIFLFKNRGQTCFAGASLSSLLHEDGIRHYIIDNRKKSNLCKLIFNLMIDPDGTENWMVRVLEAVNKHFAKEQHDCSEFLMT